MNLVFQDGRFFSHLNVRDNLLFSGALSTERAGPAFGDVAALLGVVPLMTRRSHTVSGGQRQHVVIGRAVWSRPRALRMDEPLA